MRVRHRSRGHGHTSSCMTSMGARARRVPISVHVNLRVLTYTTCHVGVPGLVKKENTTTTKEKNLYSSSLIFTLSII